MGGEGYTLLILLDSCLSVCMKFGEHLTKSHERGWWGSNTCEICGNPSRRGGGGDSHINRTGVLVKPFWRDNTNFLFGMIYVIFCQSFTKSVVSAGLTRNQLFPQD